MHNTFLPKALYSGAFSYRDTSVVRYLDIGCPGYFDIGVNR